MGTRGRAIPEWLPLAIWLLAVLPGTGVGTAATPGDEAPAHRWGIGYSKGVLLRRDLGGGWDLSLAAGPEDDRQEHDGTRQNTGEDGDPGAVLPEHHLNTVESGWVRLTSARRLAGSGRSQLAGFLTVRYRWAHRKQEEERWSFYGDSRTLTHERLDTDEWRVTLGFRPLYRLSDRLSLETTLGVSFMDQQEDGTRLEERYDDAGQLQQRNAETIDRHDRGFRDFGWTGTASLTFIYWF